MKVNGIRSASHFVQEIEVMASEKNIGYIEALLLYVEEQGIEIETVAAMVKQNKGLRDKAYAEAETLNLVDKTDKLPL